MEDNGIWLDTSSDYLAPYNQNTIDQWLLDCTSSFQKKGDLRITINDRNIAIIAIAAATVNYSLLFIRIQPQIERVLRNNQKDFRRNRSTCSQILTIRRIIEGVRAKNFEATLLCVDLPKVFTP